MKVNNLIKLCSFNIQSQENKNENKKATKVYLRLRLKHQLKKSHNIQKGNLFWRRCVVVITTALLYSSKPELRQCAGSNPAHGWSEIRNSEDL